MLPLHDIHLEKMPDLQGLADERFEKKEGNSAGRNNRRHFVEGRSISVS